MKKLLILALVLAALVAFVGLTVAQQKVEEKKPATARAESAAAMQPSQPQIIGRIRKVDRRARTVTFDAKGFNGTFPVEGPLPDAGAKVCICGSGDKDGGSAGICWGNRCGGGGKAY